MVNVVISTWTFCNMTHFIESVFSCLWLAKENILRRFYRFQCFHLLSYYQWPSTPIPLSLSRSYPYFNVIMFYLFKVFRRHDVSRILIVFHNTWIFKHSSHLEFTRTVFLFLFFSLCSFLQYVYKQSKEHHYRRVHIFIQFWMNGLT